MKKIVGNKFTIGCMHEDLRSDKALGIRFTAPYDGLIMQVQFMLALGVEGGAPSKTPILKVGLENDNGYGQPSGKYLNSVTRQVNPGEVYGAWLQTDIPPTEVTGGKPYHIIVEKTQSDKSLVLFGATNYEGARPYWYPYPDYNHYIPNLETVDVQLSLEKPCPIHRQWMPYPQGPAFLTKYASGKYYGQPYWWTWGSHLGKSAYDHVTIAVAQEFEASGTFNNVALWLKKVRQPADNLYLSLFDLANEQYVFFNTPMIKPWQKTQNRYQWAIRKLPQTITLQQEHKYRLELRSPGSIWKEGSYWRVNIPCSSVIDGCYRGSAKYSLDNGETWLKQPPYTSGPQYSDLPFALYS